MMIEGIFSQKLKKLKPNLFVKELNEIDDNQIQTNSVFSDKWEEVTQAQGLDKLESFQKEWFLKLYGFKTEVDLKRFLEGCEIVFDAGCGMGFKSAWFATLSPKTKVIGMDFSESIHKASSKYRSLSNLAFVHGDISNTGILPNSVDFVVCDQVIMHTSDPDFTFSHLSSITKKGGRFACYVYRKKALPRELLDDYFRERSKSLTNKEIWELSRQLTKLGETLSGLSVKFECPDIPLLDIKGGEYDIQRFLYWNFVKCFWKPDWSQEINEATNFDWYSPSNAKRYSKEEYRSLISNNELSVDHFHEEEACYSALLKKS